MNDWDISEQAAALHRNAIVWDMLVPLGGHLLQLFERMLGEAKNGGYTYITFTIATDWGNLNQSIHRIAEKRAYFLARPKEYVLVEQVDDVLRAKKEGKLAIGFHFQGTNALDADLNMIETYYKLGIRHMLMAYNIKNVIGDGCMERTDDGLSRFGVAVVEEMNRVGMIVDATHTGNRTTMDMFEVSKDPVIFSHSYPSALWDIPRNIKDNQIKACAKSGDVMCINGVGVFLGDNEASPEIVLRHISYVAELVGPEHVGIGTDCELDAPGRGDFEPIPATPVEPAEAARSTLYGGIYNRLDLHQAAHLHASGGKSIGPDWECIRHFEPSHMPYLTEAMLKHGYSETEVRGILGENIMRVAKQVWK